VGSKCQDDWEFAGSDDAKAVIRTAVGYLLRGATGGARGDIVQEIIAIVRQVASGLPPGRAMPWMMGFPADEARHVSDETFRHAGDTIFHFLRSPPETNLGYPMASVKQRGSIMWASILNSIYREILRTSLSGMHKLAID
jgi:hypothetical protein